MQVCTLLYSMLSVSPLPFISLSPIMHSCIIGFINLYLHQPFLLPAFYFHVLCCYDTFSLASRVANSWFSWGCSVNQYPIILKTTSLILWTTYKTPLFIQNLFCLNDDGKMEGESGASQGEVLDPLLFIWPPLFVLTL